LWLPTYTHTVGTPHQHPQQSIERKTRANWGIWRKTLILQSSALPDRSVHLVTTVQLTWYRQTEATWAKAAGCDTFWIDHAAFRHWALKYIFDNTMIMC
jgi:hypothetical protein